MITLVSDGCLKNKDGFGRVAARDIEVISACDSDIKGRTKQLSFVQNRGNIHALCSSFD